ncbi:MAG: GNVR domain-containing protein [Pseudomonadota bacterium]
MTRINVEALRRTISQLEQIVFERSREQIQLNQLERVADANRRLYEDFLGRFKESSEIQNLRKTDSEVIAYAAPPAAPSIPRTNVTLVLAVVAGVMFGFGIIFLLEFLPKRFAKSDDIVRRTGLNVFGILPRVSANLDAKGLARLLSSEGELARAAHETAQNIELALGRPARSMVLVTHDANGDKTSLAMLLGWVAARRKQRCLLVDGDSRCATLTHRFRSPPEYSDLIDVLHGKASINDAVKEAPELGVWVLPIRPTSFDPAVIFSTERASDLLKELREQFDTVIIDTPALNNETDMLMLSETMDSGLYVITSKKTSFAEVDRTISMFHGIAKVLSGAVLMNVRARTIG